MNRKPELMYTKCKKLTLSSNSPSVFKTATFTFQLNRSPRIRIRGPVILTTDGLSAVALVNRMASPRPSAASCFTSGVPFNIPSRNMGKSGVMPYE